MVSEKVTISASDPDRPRKREFLPGGPDSVTTHKARSAWFQAREAWPRREAPVELLMRARAEAATPEPAGAQWAPAGASNAGGGGAPVGPANIGGRGTSGARPPGDPDRGGGGGRRSGRPTSGGG